MDQQKIGKFIAAQRKKMKLTQMQLAERLNITDRAVSKWETGKSLPDASIMLELCEILEINVNDLLCGEVVTMDHYNKKLEETMLDMVRQKELADKRLLSLEIVIGVLSALFLFSMVIPAALVPMDHWVKILLIALGFVIFIIGTVFALRVEQVAGYYACGKCGHKHIPTYAAVLWAPHINRTRYMRCPRCKKRSWQKKVLRRE